MPRTIWMVLLSGCGGWQGMWMLTIPYVDDEDACATTITENYGAADVPPETGPVGPWTYESVFESSDSLVVLEIVEAKGNNVVVAILDQLYPGTVEGGVLTVSWTERTVDDDSEVHEAGYTFTSDTTVETVETLTLELDSDVDGASGKLDIQSTTSFAWTESDEWPPNQVGVTYTQLPSYLYLTGAGSSNMPGAADCAGGLCELSVAVDCDLGTPVTALSMGRDRDGAYAALENSGR